MEDNERPNKAAGAKPRGKRPTIGLLLGDMVDAIVWDVWAAAHDLAQERGANLICVAGGALNSPIGFNAQANVLHDLISAETVDCVALWGGSVGQFAGPEEVRRLCEQFRPLPVVSAALPMKGIPSVLVDNYQGMREAVTHLIEVHGYRRIAFIRGPEGHPEAEDRYRAYTDTLAKHGIRLDPTLVAPGEFSRQSGTRAMNLLLDQRRLQPQIDLEAIAAADDETAIGALEALQVRGIHVPNEIALVGFDNVEEGQYVTPPLTSVPVLAYEQARRTTEMALALLRGEKVPERVTVPTRLIVRQSCGCPDPAVVQAMAKPALMMNETFESALAAQRGEILLEMAQAMGTPTAGLDLALAERLTNAFVAEMGGRSPGIFIATLDEAMRRVLAAAGNVTAWQGVLSTLRRRALPYFVNDPENLARAENLWQQARVVIGETAERARVYQAFKERQWTEALREAGSLLVTSASLAAMVDVMIKDLPQLGIQKYYLSLYEDPKAPTEWSRLTVALDQGKHVELEDSERRFPSRQLLPAGMLQREDRYSMLLESLYFMENQLGFALLEVNPTKARAIEPLRTHVSSALQKVLLVQEVEERGRALQEANYALQRRAIQLETSAEVAGAITSIFDVDQLLRQTANLIRDRFGVYHVGIFLLDETGKWAVLREATGEAGAKMKAQGHRLPVDDNSIVGWTAAHREAHIALYRDEDAIRFTNPLLPDTHSEMTLPLMVGGQVLGVLNVQSSAEAAFDKDDVRALQSMADQIAVAIENARRVSDEAALLEATSPIYRASRLLTKATAREEVAGAIIESVVETGVDGCLVVEFESSSAGDPETLVYLGVWRRDREPRFQTGLRLPIAESPFPIEMVSSLWVVPDVERDARLPQSARQVFLATEARALVNIPLHSGERVIGQVVVLRATPGPFPGTALRLYEVLSDQAAVALERAQLLENAQRLAVQEQRARQMIDRIRRAVDVEQTLQVTAEEIAQTMGVPRVSIELNVQAPVQE